MTSGPKGINRWTLMPRNKFPFLQNGNLVLKSLKDKESHDVLTIEEMTDEESMQEPT
jgi:hypothetical protein